MIKFILKKIGKLAGLLLAISVLSFMLVSYSPVDPVQSYIGAEIASITPEQRTSIEEYWGLHKSKPEQYFLWAKSVVQGNLGESLIYRKPVAEIISNRFYASIALMGLAWMFSGIFGFILLPELDLSFSSETAANQFFHHIINYRKHGYTNDHAHNSP